MQKCAKMCRSFITQCVPKNVRRGKCHSTVITLSFSSSFMYRLYFSAFLPAKCICPNFKMCFSTCKMYWSKLQNVFVNIHYSQPLLFILIPFIFLYFNFFKFSGQRCYCNLVLLCRFFSPIYKFHVQYS